MSSNQSIDTEAAHDTDPFFGRLHIHAASSNTVRIRPLTDSDVKPGSMLSGRPGTDYYVRWNYQDAGVLTPKQYKQYSLMPRTAAELDMIRLYDWLVSQNVPVISNLAAITQWDARGVAFSYGPAWNIINQMVVSLRMRGTDDQALCEQVRMTLSTIGINTTRQIGPGGFFLEIPVAEMNKVPS